MFKCGQVSALISDDLVREHNLGVYAHFMLILYRVLEDR